MDLVNGLKDHAATFGLVKYLGGTLLETTNSKKAEGLLLVRNDGVVFGTAFNPAKWGNWSWDEVAGYEVLEGESRLTLSRLAALGLAGFDLRKDRSFLVLQLFDQAEGAFNLRVAAEQARSWIALFAPQELAGTGHDGPTTATCPWCAEQILAAAKKCKHCGEFLGESV